MIVNLKTKKNKIIAVGITVIIILASVIIYIQFRDQGITALEGRIIADKAIQDISSNTNLIFVTNMDETYVFEGKSKEWGYSYQICETDFIDHVGVSVKSNGDVEIINDHQSRYNMSFVQNYSFPIYPAITTNWSIDSTELMNITIQNEEFQSFIEKYPDAYIRMQLGYTNSTLNLGEYGWEGVYGDSNYLVWRVLCGCMNDDESWNSFAFIIDATTGELLLIA
jgi:hypothetical protein